MRLEACVAGLLLSTLFLPLAAAREAGGEDGCENHGTIVSVGSGNRYACTPGDGACENHGAIVLVGPNTYACPGGECVNHGVVVGVMAAYCDGSGTFVCVGSSCVRVQGASLAAAPASPEAGAPSPSLAPDAG